MVDYSELKKLAEACGNLNWRFQQENWTEYAIRDDHGYIATMRVGSPKQAGPDPDREAKAKFLGAMTPVAVLALIAENEQLREDPNMRAIRSLRGDCADLIVERDQLRAEVAGLKTGYEAYERVNAELKADVEGLRESNDKLTRRNGMLEQNVEVMTETHVLYTWLRKKCDQPSNDVVAVHMNIGHDWATVHDLDTDLRAMIEREEP